LGVPSISEARRIPSGEKRVNMKRRFLTNVVTAAQVLAEATEQMAHSTDRTTVALNSIVDNGKILYGVVSPLLGRFKAK
jgi:collagenase-like PrtC family protease